MFKISNFYLVGAIVILALMTSGCQAAFYAIGWFSTPPIGWGSEPGQQSHTEIEELKQAIRINPDDALAHYNLGVCYIGIRDKSSALRQHKILKKLDTKMAKELLGMIYTELD